MDLIDRAELIRRLKYHADGKSDFYKSAILTAVMFAEEAPTVPAVQMDKLCEWLERYATMDCDGCREAFGSCEDAENQEVSVCNSRERWKAMLTKWMEGLDDEKED